MDVDGPARGRRAPRTGLGVDVVLAGALAVIGVVGTLGADRITGIDRRVDGLALALVFAAAALVALRRRQPLAALAVITVLTAAYLLLGYPYGSVFFAFFVAVYTVAAHRELRVAVPAAAVSLAALLTHVLTHEAAIPGIVGIVPGSAWVVVPFAIGVTVRLTREARRRAQAEAVRDRVYDERLRIAQEVHDVVGHGLAAIKMQADVALHVLARRPEQAEQALTAISRTSAEALDEVRATLALVRRAETDRTPVPGLRRIDDLTTRMAEVGVQVDVDTIGTPRELPPAVELAGYRVVQESLTNVARHGLRKIAEVRIGYAPGAVTIDISNPADLSNPSADHPDQPRHVGFGITGMTERVTALGGELSAGPTGDGRFRVRASIPTGDSVPVERP
ncbi:MAG: histidine kinase [Actinomycetia bacterium]|nr:histidine kinase [Actinomycetes bacterium]